MNAQRIGAILTVVAVALVLRPPLWAALVLDAGALALVVVSALRRRRARGIPEPLEGAGQYGDP